MAIVAGATASAAAVAAGAEELFEYNRDNFIYDRKMRQETEYQIMEFRIKQAELWREDVRDIIGLTSVKMDTYLVVNAVQLGFCVMAVCEGRMAAGTPTWLIGCHTLSIVSAFTYLLMSVWLAMHASVTAKSYEVRLLTQLVRLPTPTWAQLEGARTYCSSFEKIDASQMFRVPFAQGSQESVLRRSSADESASIDEHAGLGGTIDGDTAETADLWGLEKRGDNIYELDGFIRLNTGKLRHLRLVREAMQYWQAYDAFARVSMSMGTNQLCFAFSYYVLGYVLVANHAVFAAWLTAMLFTAVAAVLVRMDMSLTLAEFAFSLMLLFIGPVITAFSCEQWSRRTPRGTVVAAAFMPVVYVAHGLWLAFMLRMCKVKEQHGNVLLPTGFRSVMYLDIFGWVRTNRERGRRRFSTLFAHGPHKERVLQQQRAFGSLEGGESLESSPPEIGGSRSGAGPAVAAVRYDSDGQPVPVRVEDLPGALQPEAPLGISRKDFQPTTFVPSTSSACTPGTADADDAEKLKVMNEETLCLRSQVQAGFLPWRLFAAGTSLLVMLWLGMGFVAFLESRGLSDVETQPLLHHRPPPAPPPSLMGWSLLHYDAQEHLHHSGQVAMALLDVSTKLSGGRALDTEWPKAGIHAQGLACAELRVPGGMPGVLELVTRSRFGLYAARLGDGEATVQFVETPRCGAIEGEFVEDVALQCDGRLEADVCRAAVLHRQGQQLASCALRGDDGNTTSSSIASAWLGEGNLKNGRAQEEVASIAIAPRCLDGSLASTGRQCVYAETTSRRIVELELQTEAHDPTATVGWQPTRVLLDKSNVAESTGAHSLPGTLTAMTSDLGGYLFSLQPTSASGAQQINAFAPSGNGAFLGSWSLPADRRWTGMCATSVGRNATLLLLAEAQEEMLPQLWQFPLSTALLQNLDSALPDDSSRLPPQRRSHLRQQRRATMSLEADGGSPAV